MTGEEIWTKELFDVNGVWKPPNNWLRTKHDEIYRQYVEDTHIAQGKLPKPESYECKEWRGRVYRSQEVAQRAVNIYNATWPATPRPHRPPVPCPSGADHWHG